MGNSKEPWNLGPNDRLPPDAEKKLFESMFGEGARPSDLGGEGSPPKGGGGCPLLLVRTTLQAAAWVVRTWMR